MFPVNRCKLVVALIALFLSVGCISTSPAPDSGTHEELEPVAETSDSNAVALHQEPVALKPVYFDTNEAMLRADARDLLKSYAQSILDHPEWGVVTIEGHCDERGSDEYNRALGRRVGPTLISVIRDELLLSAPGVWAVALAPLPGAASPFVDPRGLSFSSRFRFGLELPGEGSIDYLERL